MDAFLSGTVLLRNTVDVFVPPEQVLDTVDIYFIKSRQRRLSLRFLSWLVLKQNIQTGTHDSIEDARSALLLYKAFLEYEAQGIWDEKLEELYKEGKQLNWKPPPLPEAPATSPPVSPPPPMMPPYAAYVQNNMLQSAFNRNQPFRTHGAAAFGQPNHSFMQHPSSTNHNWRRGNRQSIL